jgi:hypothetical protein
MGIEETLDTVQAGETITVVFSRDQVGLPTTVKGEAFRTENDTLWVRTSPGNGFCLSSALGWVNKDISSITKEN